ncbi:MAG: hypothetical protein WAV38_38000, partial [Xanthobacteraceae bacterium]
CVALTGEEHARSLQHLPDDDRSQNPGYVDLNQCRTTPSRVSGRYMGEDIANDDLSGRPAL